MALLKSGTRIYGNAIIDTNLSINGSTVSSNYQSGALVVAGGVGIAGNVFINANLNAKDTLITGNLTVTGTTTTVNSTTTQLQDPIVDIGGGANGTALTTDDGLARGLALNYYNVGPKTGFIGWDNANIQFAVASNVSNTTGTLIINTYGDLKANSFIGNIVGTSNLSQLTVNGISRFGNVGNVKITGGSPNYILQTDGQGNLVWVAPSTTTAAGANTQVQFNTGNAFDASANFVFDNSSKTLTVDKITANGAGLFSVTGANVTGFVPNANVSNTAYNVAGANVTGQVGNALVSGTVYSNAQPNITSVGTLTSLAVTGNVTANYFIGNGSQLTGINTSSLDGNFHARIISNVSNIVAGSALDIVADYSNTVYPAGIFTINQLGPVSITTTDSWASGGTNKNAYANFISSTINTQNISITLSLANANFNIQTTDTITIGGSSVTGGNITALGITGTGGTFTIPSAYLSTTPQTQSTSAVSVNLTTSRGMYASTGSTLTNNQPVPFNVTALSGTFPAATVPYWSLNQTFTWNATTTAGATVLSGNVTYANTANSVSGTLVSNGATSGTSTSLDSTMSYTITSSDYTGAGQYGAGTRTMTATVNGTVAAATKYYPLFWKTTSNSTLPTFTTSDSRNSNNYALGQGAATSTTTTNYLWLATPNSTPHTFKHVFLGSDIVDTPDVTGTTTISGQTYSVWGFTNFSQVTTIVTTS
jgi:hypothetical protein